MTTETLYQVYLRSPDEALKEAFRREAEYVNHYSYMPQRIFVSCSAMGIHGKCRYGSYRYLTPQDLLGREFTIEFLDGKISIFWTDVVHDPRTHQNIKKELLDVEAL